MIRVVTLVLASSLLSCAYAAQDESVSGTYRLQVSDQARSLAHVLGQPAPDGALILGADHVFEIVYRTVNESTHRFGRYWVDNDQIELRFRNRNQDLEGTIHNGAVVLGGVEYRSDYWRPSPVTSVQRAVFSPDPNPPKLILVVAPPVLAPAPVVAPFDAVGSWSVRNHGIEDATSVMKFDKTGNFSFSGHGARSQGHYTVHDGVITLVWTQIDDDLVEEGTVKKDVPICGDAMGFDIDTYHYERCSK